VKSEEINGISIGILNCNHGRLGVSHGGSPQGFAPTETDRRAEALWSRLRRRGNYYFKTDRSIGLHHTDLTEQFYVKFKMMPRRFVSKIVEACKRIVAVF